MWGLGLSPGAGVLLGGILAPTDPVLASGIKISLTLVAVATSILVHGVSVHPLMKWYATHKDKMAGS